MEIEKFIEQKEEKAKIAAKIVHDMGITAEEAAEAIARVMRALPPLGEEEINNIKRNPSLSWFQKWRLIREIRKGASNERSIKS